LCDSLIISTKYWANILNYCIQISGDIIKTTIDAYAIMILREYIAEADREANLMLGEIWEKAKLIDIVE